MAREEAELGEGSLIDGEYELEARLGRGGFATVWRARHLLSQERVALKIFHPKVLSGQAARRIRREAQLLLDLRHPNIGSALQVRLEQTPSYLVLELLEGQAMNELIRERCKLGQHVELAYVRQALSQLCEALRFAHERGVIHRDLKPHNVMLTGEDRAVVKVIDFGIARLLDTDADRATTQGRVLGSVFYMAPEQARGREIDQRVDVFALGCVLFELLTLRRAWVHTTDGEHALAFAGAASAGSANTPLDVLRRSSSGLRPKASRYRPSLSAAVDEIIARATAALPDERYPSVAAFWGDLEAALPRSEDIEAQNAQDQDLTRLASRLTASPYDLDQTPAAPSSGAPISSASPTLTLTGPTPTGDSLELQIQAQYRPWKQRGTRLLAATAVGLTLVSAVVTSWAVLRSRASETSLIALASPEPRAAQTELRPVVAASAEEPPLDLPNPDADAGDVQPADAGGSPATSGSNSTATNRTSGAKSRPPPSASVVAKPDEALSKRRAELRARLRTLQEDPTNAEALRRLRALLLATTQDLGDTESATKIRRLVESSAALGDVDGLSRAVRDLEDVLGAR